MATIALIAHNARKDDLVNFVTDHIPVLARYRLIATDATAQRIQTATNLPIEHKMSGALGGDAQIASEIVEGNVIALIFLVDPLYAQPHEPGTTALLRLCNVHNVATATNLATAEAVISKLANTLVAHLIYNPTSGQGSVDQDLDLIKQLLQPHMNLHIHETAADTHPRELVKEAIAQKADIVIASGGDGTVSAIAGALIGTDIPLGIIPRGTANAFAVALGIPRLQPIRAACQTILDGHTLKVDAARCNGKPMILLAGVGYEAETVELANREMKDQWGAMGYFLAGWQVLDEQNPFDAVIEAEGEVHEIQATAITVANAAPATSILAQGAGEVVYNDGLLDVTIAGAETKLQAITTMLRMLGAALTKGGVQQQNVVHGRTRKISITTNPPQKVVLDGELIGITPIDVECIPGGLTVLAPIGANLPSESAVVEGWTGGS